jgi:hypothetical protein
MDEIYTQWISRFVITRGVKAEADENGSHWFADVIGSYQVYRHMQAEEFQVWVLTIHPGKCATVVCHDGNGRELVRQPIEFSDHPPGGAEWWLVGSGGSTPVLMLPEEY